MSFLVIALAVLALMTTAYMNVVRPAQKRRKAAAPEPIPAAEPKVPCDTSRPYPRGDSAATEELLRTCPVCGMTDLDQMIEEDLTDFFGWPAHASCKEWLGDWKPQRPAPPPYKPDTTLIGYMERGQKPVPKPAEPPVPTPAEYLAELQEHLHHFEEKYPD